MIKTGKALTHKATDIRIVFKAPRKGYSANVLVFRIQPEEGIELDLLVKQPGLNQKRQMAPMEYSYKTVFSNNGHPDAYERVLVDALKNDHTFFPTGEEVIEAWRIVDPVLNIWANSNKGLFLYDNGSSGPQEADRLAERTGVFWNGGIVNR